jgi:hypothetical protein
MDSRITIEQYTESVEKLVGLAQQHSSGARVAAQVLLSAYNGCEFPLDIADLSCLNDFYYRHAINIIRGRAECLYEPQRKIKNGSKIFVELCDDWHSLHISERHKV